MTRTKPDAVRLRRFRNSRPYRSCARLMRAYNRRLAEELRERGFDDYSPAFPALLSNLDLAGSHIGTLAQKAGVTRQAAGQLLKSIAQCGYVELLDSPRDTRATLVKFTPRGRKLLANVIEVLGDVDREMVAVLGEAEFQHFTEQAFRLAERIDPGGALVGEE
ncbi:MAG: MarR family winged helix-turn-helix transcriptional regulator [Vicinamibacterales bacterium]